MRKLDKPTARVIKNQGKGFGVITWETIACLQKSVITSLSFSFSKQQIAERYKQP